MVNQPSLEIVQRIADLLRIDIGQIETLTVQDVISWVQSDVGQWIIRELPVDAVDRVLEQLDDEELDELISSALDDLRLLAGIVRSQL